MYPPPQLALGLVPSSESQVNAAAMECEPVDTKCMVVLLDYVSVVLHLKISSSCLIDSSGRSSVAGPLWKRKEEEGRGRKKEGRRTRKEEEGRKDEEGRGRRVVVAGGSGGSSSTGQRPATLTSD